MKFVMNRETPAAKLGYGIIMADKRGVIKGNLPVRLARLGGDMSNEQFRQAHNLSTKRQASKVRNHIIPMPRPTE